ncbi:lysylphosphatidylglycerol synthase domain-containing protein [Nocardioides sp. HM23]|uniref:lysylphosphatidylglycerol synthase domain-containing protein n=1 Tax=Nocardioides bizhenqiangii TaxID=3095076 RepID=UPI002ACA0E66|nr:lysylphosphatidylglycerol synthase domain-containing protein [Nocardioides sp. HM23]MDZ5620112.1 lysylphosphatidylglycerol synthase domain-containing protein [Nocardioides sp. HM23]MDZ5623479.1 lysylphosphatidylglycerol synthase domain-containing protein [Nocardioides sp. HM23]
MLILVGLVAIFGWLLPQFIDYEEVWDALARLDGWEIVALLGLALVRIPSEALLYRGLLPGLSLWRGSAAYLSSNLAGQLGPPPTPSLIQYGYFRGGGFDADAAGLAAFGTFLFPTVGRFLLPVVAVFVVLIAGELTGTVVLAGALSLVITTVMGTVAYVILRTESSARWLGAKGQRPLSKILVRFKRRPITDGPNRAAALRTRARAVLIEGWKLGTVAVALNLFLTYLILLASLRFVGVPSHELSVAAAFAAFAIAFWAGAVIPITGSGLGVVDAVLVTMLVELSTASDELLVAAAVLWRFSYSVIILPLGAITLARYRRTR